MFTDNYKKGKGAIPGFTRPPHSSFGHLGTSSANILSETCQRILNNIKYHQKSNSHSRAFISKPSIHKKKKHNLHEKLHDRQADRQTDRQTDRETGRQLDRQTDS